MGCLNDNIYDFNDCPPFVNRTSFINAVEQICTDLEIDDCTVILPISIDPQDFIVSGWGGVLPDATRCKILTVIYSDGSDIYKAYNNGADTVFYSTQKKTNNYFIGRLRASQVLATPTLYTNKIEFLPSTDIGNNFYNYDEVIVKNSGVHVFGYQFYLNAIAFVGGYAYLKIGLFINDILQEETKHIIPVNYYEKINFFSAIYYENLFDLDEGDKISLAIDQVGHSSTPLATISAITFNKRKSTSTSSAINNIWFYEV